MKKRILLITACLVLAFALCLGFLYFNHDIGISQARMEERVRETYGSDRGWAVEGSASDKMAAYISYAPDQSAHSFSVYVNRPGLSFGYFFRGGGRLDGVNGGILEYTVENCMERAFISLNTQQVSRLEFDDGTDIQVMELDSGKPFAIVLPVNLASVTFYDADGNVVPYESRKL